MRKDIVGIFRGGRMRRPLSFRTGRTLRQVLTALLAVSLLVPFAGKALAQRQPRPGLKRPPVGQKGPTGAPNAERAAEAKTILELLRKMVRPTVEYVGTQETEVFGPNAQTSQQNIKGDSRGHVRIEFQSPQRVAGDVMLISPGEFHNFHKHNNLVETANWPTEWNDQEKRLFGLVRQGVVSVRKTGEEQVAGRLGTIIELSQRSNGIVERKFWIDAETGIQLKIEKYNLRGQLSSRTTMHTLAIGSEARVIPQDFQPNFPGANRTPLFPGAAPFRTLAEAQGRLPFRALEPASLPVGFHLDGVWSFDTDAKRPKFGNVLMRYTDGVSSFSLYQRIAPAKTAEMPPPRSFKNNQQRWLKSAQDGTVMVQYIGHLSAEQAEALYNSLH